MKHHCLILNNDIGNILKLLISLCFTFTYLNLIKIDISV